MNIRDALKILSIDKESVDFDDAKAAYKAAALKFHPDRNPAGHKMMTIINAAWEFLNSGKINFPINGQTTADSQSFSEAINTALNAIINLDGIDIEVCGSWVWVSGQTKKHKDILKANGFFFAPKKIMWYYRHPSNKTVRFKRGSLPIDDIREKYGSMGVAATTQVISA